MWPSSTTFPLFDFYSKHQKPSLGLFMETISQEQSADACKRCLRSQSWRWAQHKENTEQPLEGGGVLPSQTWQRTPMMTERVVQIIHACCVFNSFWPHPFTVCWQISAENQLVVWKKDQRLNFGIWLQIQGDILLTITTNELIVEVINKHSQHSTAWTRTSSDADDL